MTNTAAPLPMTLSTDATHRPLMADWDFIQTDDTTLTHAHMPPTQWEQVSLPHDFSVLSTPDEKNPSGGFGGFYAGGIGLYRKSFSLFATDANKRITIVFEGIYQQSDVWINGHHLGHRPNGFIPLRYDITDYVTLDQENLIEVRANNSEQPNCRWYTGSGIYRPVSLHIQEPVLTHPWEHHLHWDDITSQRATGIWRSSIHNTTSTTQTCEARFALYTPTGDIAWEHNATHQLPPGSEYPVELVPAVGTPQYWTAESPHPYTAICTLTQSNGNTETHRFTTGIRSLLFTPDKGLLVNGTITKLKGVCEHLDGGMVGAALTPELWKRKLTLLKRMGCNAIRISHNPSDETLLQLCDDMGFYVIEEAFDVWREAKPTHGYHRFFDQWAERDLSDMIKRSRNHPCIIMWSLGNEIKEADKPESVKTATWLKSIAKTHDPHRPVTMGLNRIHAANKSGITDVLDVVGYNGGGGSCFQYEKDKANYPDRCMYASEVPHSLQTRGVYRTQTQFRDEAPEGGVMTCPSLREEEVFNQFDENYRSSYDNAMVRINCRESWRLTRDLPFMAGEFRWTGFDYLGESPWPNKHWHYGVIDICGFPKDSYYLYQSQWTDGKASPMVHILPHWTWPGMEGASIPVVVYSNAEAVELFLNGTSLGRQSRGNAMELQWDVGYTPGIISAKAYNGDQCVATTEHHTAGKPTSIALTQETPATPGEINCIQFSIVDDQGCEVPHANIPLHVHHDDALAFIGLDNGDTLDHQPFNQTTRKSFHGKALLMVQPTNASPAPTVIVSSPGLPSHTLTLTTKDSQYDA